MKKTPALTRAVFHILLSLADGPLHGYGIMQAVEGSAAGPSRRRRGSNGHVEI